MTDQPTNQQLDDLPAPTVQTTGYLVSCLPEGHDDRWTYTVRVSYRGDGLWSVQARGQYVDANGQRSPGFSWSGCPDEPATQAEMDAFDAEQAVWLKAFRFEHDEALRIAKQLAPKLMYRGVSVADVLAGRAVVTPAVPCMRSDEHPAHLHSGVRAGNVVHGKCPGVPAVPAVETGR